MAGMAERYDELAVLYERWWAPVLAPTARSLADSVRPTVDARPDAWLLDIGTGTGTLAVELVERYPSAHVTGVDSSRGMLDEARSLARRRLSPAAARHLEFVRGDAGRLPFADESFDAVVSSFVFQLVPDRFAALREARRVLRPGGTIAVLTWLADDDPFEPDEALEDAIDELELDFDDDEADHRSGNYRSAGAAASQVRRAGFRDVSAEERDLVHRYDPTTYLEFLEAYAERDLFAGLDRRDRDRLRQVTQRRLSALGPDEFVWRTGVVTVTGRRPR